MNKSVNIVPESKHSLSGPHALQLLEGVPEGVVVIDGQNSIVFFNAAAEAMWGYSRKDVIGRNAAMLLPDGMRDEHDALINRNRQTGVNTIVGTSREIMFQNQAGDHIPAELAISAVEMVPEGEKYYLASIKGITDESHRRNILDLQNTVFRSLSTDMMIGEIADLVCREIETFVPDTVALLMLVDENRKLEILSGVGFPRRYAAALENVVLSDADMTALAQTPSDADTVVWNNYYSLGISLGLHHCWASSILSAQGQVSGILALFSRNPGHGHEGARRIVDGCVPFCGVVIEQYAARQHIAHLVRYDPLTGFFNRAALHDFLDKQVGQPGDHHFAVVMLNLDRFRDINEALGHANGDLFLKVVSERIRRLSRSHYVLGRSSADEFIIILPETDEAGAIRFAQALIKGLTQPVDVHNNYIVPSLGIGISMFPHTGSDSESLISLAESAMRQVKKEAPGTYRIAIPDDHSAAQDRLLLGSALRKTLEEGRLALHYQPQIDGRSGQLYGVEALARWHHPHLGNIFPSRFIAVAEATGQIEAIGTWSLQEACQQIVAWERAGIHVPTVAVNLSAGHFRKRQLPVTIDQLLKAYAIGPHRLTVEITESVMMDENPDTMAVLHAIRAMGVGLSMDDFGTGFSSLSRLTRLPLTEIKIDRSFIMNLEHDANAQAVTTAVIGIGSGLGMTVVTEGVETPEQKALLQTLHCDVMQGYLFSKPLPPDALGQWLLSRKNGQSVSQAIQ
ncbi:EAL domain-containing protein [Komagataeibacter xylinus]|uniref:EAL domain-containing protein n=1 Tax=Komagataeibacter xylinus TaxID=28448 RepID=A0A857FKE5_KOMXY|nr:EAL domain-containing protein [Komagataeibacter xylinus]QHC34676.1 EAL domain-containing protein [Komagataeibacter xylinus]